MRFARRHIAAIVALAAFAIVACAFGAVLASADQAVPDNPCATFDESASSVVWAGQGWTAPADEERERNIVKHPDAIVELPSRTTEEDVRDSRVESDSDTLAIGGGDEPLDADVEPKAENVAREDDDGDGGDAAEEEPKDDLVEDESEDTDEEQPDDGADDERDGEEAPANGDDVETSPEESSEPSPSKGTEPDAEGFDPFVSTDLTDGEVVQEDSRDFSVTATDYEGSALGSDSVVVAMAADGGADVTLEPTGEDGTSLRYNLPMDGERIAVTILAVDADGRSTILELTVHRAEAEDVFDGSITFSVEAGTVGLGTLIGPEPVAFQGGEPMSSVLVRTLEDAGYGVAFKGSVERSFYLQHITHPGITEGWEIPKALLAHLEDVGYTPTDHHEDSLGEYDFTGTSGWMYSVNGSLMSSNMSSYYPADGDEVRVRFSLYSGSDIGGDDGPQWDEEW